MNTVSTRIAGALFVLTIVAISALAAWPIYQSRAFLVLVAVSVVVAIVIAGVVAWRKWNGWAAAGLLTFAVLALGVPLAVPSRASSPTELVRGLGEVLWGVVVGWKDLLTVDLPIGSYRNLLVPALVIFLVGTCVALLCASLPTRRAYFAVPVVFAMTSFGLLFGGGRTSEPIAIGNVTVTAPVESLVGIVSLLASIAWLSWRESTLRRGELRRAAQQQGLRVRRRAKRADRRRAVLGTVMVVAAGAMGFASLPTLSGTHPRAVLREGLGPIVELSDVVSPLAQYRALAAEDTAPVVMFTVQGSAPPERLRFATLSDYDGEVFTVAEEVETSLKRVPDRRSTVAGAPIDLTVTVRALDMIWMPVAGDVADVTFTGPRASELADGFYYDPVTGTAIETTAWTAGDGYRVEAAAPAVPALTDISAPGGVSGEVAVPETVRRWVAENTVGSGGVALEHLITLLRERGYLSRSLTDQTLAWASDYPDYQFLPSASGHSLGRIEEMFEALLTRSEETDGSGNLVAAIGDDEQFATAAALIAQELGFPARVVVGVRLSSSDPTVTTCRDGACRAQDVSAWIEVRAASGEWIPVDVTPQHSTAPETDIVQQQDPRVPTEVRPDDVEDVKPPGPDQDERLGPVDEPPTQADLTWLWTTLQIAGISLVVLLATVGPFLAVIVAKAFRRRGRRRRGDPGTRITRGWDEYSDAVIDAGGTRAPTATRRELAEEWQRPQAILLAEKADKSVFADESSSDEDARAFWQIVDQERDGLSVGFWKRVRSAVSLRSFRGAARAPRRPFGNREGESEAP